MARISKLTPELEQFVMGEAARGKSCAAISRMLAKRGVSITAQSLGEFLRKHRNERADVAKAVVREKLVEGLTADLAVLAEVRDGLLKTWRKVRREVAKLHGDALTESKALTQYVKLAAELRCQVETNLEYSGAGQPDEKFDGLAEFLASAFGDYPLGDASVEAEPDKHTIQ